MKRILTLAFLCIAQLSIFNYQFSIAQAQAQPQVDFVTSSIVRVRWSANGELAGNGTDVCTWKPQQVEVTSKETATGRTYSSETLTVQVDKKSGAVTFRDRKTGRILLQEDAKRPHEAEPVVTERIVYDEQSAHIEETANGKVTVKDVVRRDTLGMTTRYRVRFRFADSEALYGLGSHMEDYMNLMGKTLYLTLLSTGTRQATV